MSNETNNTPNFVRLELTAEQKAHVRNTTGMSLESIELSAKELEERVAPRMALLEDNIAPRTFLNAE